MSPTFIFRRIEVHFPISIKKVRTNFILRRSPFSYNYIESNNTFHITFNKSQLFYYFLERNKKLHIT